MRCTICVRSVYITPWRGFRNLIVQMVCLCLGEVKSCAEAITLSLSIEHLTYSTQQVSLSTYKCRVAIASFSPQQREFPSLQRFSHFLLLALLPPSPSFPATRCSLKGRLKHSTHCVSSFRDLKWEARTAHEVLMSLNSVFDFLSFLSRDGV